MDVFDFVPEKPILDGRQIRIIIPTASLDSRTFKKCLTHINETPLPKDSIVTAVVSNGPDFCFSKSINAGLSRVSVEDILLLNDDCYIDPNAVRNLVSSLAHNDGIVGGVLRYEDGRIQHYGGVVKSSFLSILSADTANNAPFYAIRSYFKAHQIGTKYIRTYHYTRKNEGPIDYVTGALFFIRNEAFKDIGFMDENLVNDWEDLDYCLRAQKKGYAVRVQDDVTAIHQEHVSLKELKQNSFEKLKVFNEKWGEKDLSDVLHR